jgi:hypothetical protein
VAHWDNSENNLSNPDPSATVNWGDQTFEEMMIGFFDVAVPIDRDKLLAEGKIPQLEPNSTVEDRAKELVANFDRDGDGKLQKEELPQRFQMALSLIDTNGDEVIDVAEATAFVKLSGGRGFGGRRGGGGGFGGGRGGNSRRGDQGENDKADKPDAPKTP